MSRTSWVTCIVLITLCCRSARAVDLKNINRIISKEPTYQSEHLGYCLLVFGPNADFRVWLVMDGNSLYVDRNGNGDLTETGEQNLDPYQKGFRYSGNLGDLIEPKRKVAHRNLKLYRSGPMEFELEIDSHSRGRQYIWHGGQPALKFASRPEEAPIVHFDGPLVFSHYETKIPEIRSGKRNSLDFMVGTPGLGKGTFAACSDRHCLAKKHGPLHATFTFRSRTTTDGFIEMKASFKPDG